MTSFYAPLKQFAMPMHQVGLSVDSSVDKGLRRNSLLGVIVNNMAAADSSTGS